MVEELTLVVVEHVGGVGGEVLVGGVGGEVVGGGVDEFVVDDVGVLDEEFGIDESVVEVVVEAGGGGGEVVVADVA